MNRDDTELVVTHRSSGAEALAKKIPHARVVSAFNTVPSEVLFGVFAARHRKTRPSLIYCGDDSKSKKLAARLIHDVVFIRWMPARFELRVTRNLLLCWLRNLHMREKGALRSLTGLNDFADPGRQCLLLRRTFSRTTHRQKGT